MKIIKTKYRGTGSEYINFYGVENGSKIFGVDATCQRQKESFFVKPSKWTKWTVSFGSCNGDIDFMKKRIKVINRALKEAIKLNK